MISSDAHSASSTLDDIINELKLTYDSSVGILDGEAIREIPSLSVLLAVNKSITKLSKELDEVEKIDYKVLDGINDRLGASTKKAKAKNDEINNEDSSAEPEEKREREDNDVDEETIPLAKRRKPNALTKIKTEEVEEVEEEEEDPPEDAEKEDKEAEKDNEEEDGKPKEEDEEEEDENGVKVEATGDEERVNSKDDPVPPVQLGSFTQDNDTRLKNPKSEFVTSQTLPADAILELGLYSEDNQGLETHGKEFLKKKYGVASYPERDIQDLLPGEIPNIDFSKNKPPTNQVQFTTFQSYIESYFRPFSNDDISFLTEKYIIPPTFEKSDYDPNVTPYLIPKAGTFYADVWAEEDSNLASKLNSPAYQQSAVDSYKPKGSIDSLSDEKLYTEDISCGPLSSRLLSAILSINETDERDDDDNANGNYSDNENDSKSVKKEPSIDVDILSNMRPISDDDIATRLSSGEEYKVTTEVSDFHSIEERLKRELKHIGIFMNLPNLDDKSKINGKLKKTLSDELGTSSIIDTDEWIRNKEDDEVCAEIRALQKELKEVSHRNRQRKKKLIPVVEEQIAYQEYCTILEDLDKQVDQAYIKRTKAKNKKKKHSDTNTPQQQAVNNGLRVLLDKRKRWIENIGKLFPPAETMKRVPKESVFKGDDQSDDEDIDGDDDVENDAEALIQSK